MTPVEAIYELDDSIDVWSRFACEPNNREPEEMEALRRARVALDVLRTLAVESARVAA